MVDAKIAEKEGKAGKSTPEGVALIPTPASK